MKIQPNGHQPATGTRIGRSGSTASDATSSIGGAPSRSVERGDDRVTISPEARELLAAADAAATETPSLDPERLLGIFARLGDGFYDRADVQRDVLSRIRDELGLGSAD